MSFKRNRIPGPDGVVRPFKPLPEFGNSSLPTEEKLLETLEHIARSLSAIDHNIEMFLHHYTRQQKQS